MARLKTKEQILEEGRQRMTEWGPRAKAEAEKELQDPKGVHMQATSALGNLALKSLTEDNFDALTVYEAEDKPGFWHADLVLKNTPIGVPDSMGTPVADPCPSRKKAEEVGYMLLVQFWIVALQQKQDAQNDAQKDVRIFDFGEVSMNIPGEAIDELAAMLAHMPYAATENLLNTAPQRLEAVVKDIAGDEDITSDHLNAATEDQRRALYLAASLMLITGQFRYYPPSESGSGPSFH